VGQTLVHAPRAAADRGLWSLAARSILRPPLATDQPIDLQPARQRLLAWLETLRGQLPAGHYASQTGASQATLEGSALAALIRGVLSAPALDERETATWSQYLRSQLRASTPQGPASLEGSANAAPGSESKDWRETILAITALRSLGDNDPAPLPFVEPFLQAGEIADWLGRRNWTDPRQASRQARWLAISLAHEHARTHAAVYWQALEAMGAWLAAKLGSEAGPWTFDQPLSALEAFGNACNLAPLLALLGHPFPASQPLIATALDLQRFSGLFGADAPDEAWADLAVVDALARLSRLSDYRASEIKLAMALAVRAILRQQLPDGGFGFSRRSSSSELCPTWLRSLTLAIIGTRWPELITARLSARLPPLPELGSGHAASAALAERLARP